MEYGKMVLRNDVLMIVYLLIGTTICFTVAGNLLLKAGMLDVGTLPSQAALIPGFFFQSLTNPKVVAGLAMAFLAAMAWIGAVSQSQISFAYPFMSLTVVLVLLLSGLLFGEVVPINRWLGVIIVCLGLIVAARG
jgi:drug/metabolite transporter (DMT)-like permease